MAINVREKTIEEIEERLSKMNTELNKISYLESALRETGFSYEIKRFIWRNLAELYDKRKMYEKAGKVMSNKAGVEITTREKIESYLSAAEFYSKAGKVDDSDEMFFRALRDASGEQKTKIKLARKNIYLVSAQSLEYLGKKASAIKFYEKLIKSNLEEIEKGMIKEKLLLTYKSLGMFREARLLEGV
jgi:tetratricopeptide (TPR) repeat protein